MPIGLVVVGSVGVVVVVVVSFVVVVDFVSSVFRKKMLKIPFSRRISENEKQNNS